MGSDIKSESKSLTENRIPAELAREIDRDLAAWFVENQRSLNFRQTTDPYAVMVSEFMLQQTTVAAVEPYFERFLAKFPKVSDLAAATEDEVMAMWAGLGYYRRARQLHAAAKVLTEDYGGEFPRDASTLVKLPGFGRYTAGAVSSLAFDLPAPILEANTVRVFSRLAGIPGTVGDSAFMKTLWKIAGSLVGNAKSPRVFNTAAMELGSLVCRPQPLCDKCPVAGHCRAYRMDVAEKIPTTRVRRPTVDVNCVGIVSRDSANRYGVEKIPAGEWHAGMWHFPTFRVNDVSVDENVADRFAKEYFGADARVTEEFLTLSYQVTHHKVRCHVFHCQIKDDTAEQISNNRNMRFLCLDEIAELPMGSAQKKLLQVLIKMEASEKSL